MGKRPLELEPELKRLFVEEADHKANEISHGIARLQEQDQDHPQLLDHMVWLQMRFAEYSGIANTLGLFRSGQACALVVDELTQVIGGARDAEDSLPALFDDALVSIDDALEFLHGDDIDPTRVFEPIHSDPTVAEQLPDLLFPDVNQLNPTTSNRLQNQGITQPYPQNIDASLLEVFLDEAEELLERGNTAWNDWTEGRHTHDAINELRRVFHTLKGGARLTQMLALGNYLHAAEEGMDHAQEFRFEDKLKRSSRATLDQTQQAIAAIRQGQAAFINATENTAHQPKEDAKPAPLAPAPAQESVKPVKNFVRVRTKTLENLRLRITEVNALRTQIQQISRALQTEQALSIQTATEATNTLRDARFALERLIDRLPAAQGMQLSDSQLESQIALQALEDILLRLARHNERGSDLSSYIERALQGQNKAGFSLQEDIINTRLVPFTEFAVRLKRIVSQATSELTDKAATLTIKGARVEVDRQLIEQLLPALEHMLRNAVVHGIETQEQRRNAGKTPVGEITLHIKRSRGKLALDVQDDGAGLALEKIQAKAVKLGLIPATEQPDQRRLARLIFHPGLSVQEQASQLAGRGVGMDVVEHTVHDLGGRIDVNTQNGHGTQFNLRLPMGETSIEVVIVHIADEVYAIPQDSIRCVQRLDDQTLSQGYQENIPIAWAGHGWQVQSLGHWLGLGAGQLTGPRTSLPALLINHDDQYFAVVVDSCGDSAEYALESLPPAVTGILGISGAVVLEDGQIAPVLDLPILCSSQLTYQRQHLQLTPPDATTRYKVMIVEDSTTWLRQLTRGLNRYPLDITACNNGQEALNQLEKAQPQILIVDLEMPRMDGLEFLRRLRRNPQFNAIPAIMFSSVTSTTQRNRARQLGAKAWVTKSGNLKPLLVAIDKQLGTEFAPHEADILNG